MVGLAVIAAVASYAVAVATAPLIRRAAVNRKLLDYPDGGRHGHAEPVPRLGGIAVFLGLIVGMGIGMSGVVPGSPSVVPRLGLAMLFGGTILFAIGLFDDLRGVPPIGKIVGQSIAALIVWSMGFRIEHLILLPGVEVSLGWAALPVTILWIVGVSNAFNLVDGMDGLAGTVAILALMAAMAAALTLGNDRAVWYSLALAGGLLGFLRYNFAPARIFLGDSGSLVVGFLLAVLTVRGATDARGFIHAAVPIFALAYPLLDTGVAILRRWLRGEPLSRADGRHIHHQLQSLGLTSSRSVALIALFSAAVSLLGLSVTFARPEFTVAIALAGGVALLLVMTFGLRWLEYHEFSEAGAAFANAARRARSVIQDKIVARDLACLVAEARTFEELQDLLRDHAPKFRFVRMELRSPSMEIGAGVATMIRSTALATTAWRLEYPVTDFLSGMGEVVFLNIWCATVNGAQPAGAERVARILAPALLERLRTAPDILEAFAARPLLPLDAIAEPRRTILLLDDPALTEPALDETPAHTA